VILELEGEVSRRLLNALPPLLVLPSDAWESPLLGAADLLLEPDATIGSVAHQVGYSTPFALSTAFKRVRGISPRQYRLAAS